MELLFHKEGCEIMDAYIALGYACNHSCLCCPLTTYDRLHKQLSLEELNQKISNLLNRKSNDNTINVVLSGGEPFLNSNIFDVLLTLLTNNCNVTVLTNSTQIIKPDIQTKLQNIIEINNNFRNRLRIVSAIHSSNNEIHDYLTGCKGSLWETLEGLDYIVSQNIPVTVKIILNKANKKVLVDTVKYLDEHFPVDVKLQFCGMDYSGRAEKHLDELLASFQELQPYVESALDYLEDSNAQRAKKQRKSRAFSFLELPLCLCDPYYWRYFTLPPDEQQLYIAPNEEVFDSKHLSVVQLQCGTFYEECTRCVVRDLCYGTWKTTYKYVNNLLRPIKTN